MFADNEIEQRMLLMDAMRELEKVRRDYDLSTLSEQGRKERLGLCLPPSSGSEI